MYINPRIKKFFGLIFAVVMIVVAIVLVIKNPGPEHIEDTNGPDNYALQQITPEDVVAQEMGARGGLTTEEKKFGFAGISVSKGLKYSCKQFTDVSQVYTSTIFKGSDILVRLEDFRIESGNFAFFVILDGEIVAELRPDESGRVDYTFENVEDTGCLEYVIAGESANFQFSVPQGW